MATKRTLLDAWLRGPKKVALNQEINPPDTTGTVGRASADHPVPSQQAQPSALDDRGCTGALSTQRRSDCHNEDERSRQPLAKFHPSRSYVFPKNNSDRTCQHSWFEKFPWLHYIEDRDVVVCHECIEASRERRDDPAGIELSFIKNGFSNWKKALERFRGHEKSRHHVESVAYRETKKRGLLVVGLLTKHASKQQEEARAALRVVISSVRYLCTTGQALQGRTKQDGNLLELLEERSEDLPALKGWLTRRDRWLSGDIQNELIGIMAEMLQRALCTAIKTSLFFGIIADGTTDVTGDEQFTLCLRWVDRKSITVKEDYIGVYNPLDTKSETLFSAVKDMIVRLGFSLDNLRGMCFDGAANMSGRFSGVQKRILDVQPKSVYIHCSNHSLDLALQEVGRSSEMVGDALTIVKDVSNIILDSAKRKGIYANIVLPPVVENVESGPPPTALLPLCPTRWAVRVKSVRRFLENYDRVRATLREILQTPDSIRDDLKAAMRGFEKLLGKLETVFGLNTAIAVFGPCEELARTLQSVSYSATGAKQAATMLEQTLTRLRSDVGFEKVWQNSKKAAEKLGLKQPSSKSSRAAGPPARFEQTSTPARPATLDAKARLRKEFFAVIDCVTEDIKRRFDQPGMNRLVTLEAILISAASGHHHSAGRLEDELGVHASDFDLDKLEAQLMLLPTISTEHMRRVEDVSKALKESSQTVRDLLDQVVTLVELLLTVPASAATGERSFSALKRVKTYLRNRMTQKRLGHLLLLHVHKEKTRQLNLNTVMREFVARTAERTATFGALSS